MKTFVNLILCLCMLMIVHSCNDNSIDVIKTQEELYEDSLEIRERQLDRDQLLYNLCQIDTLTDNRINYIPRHGKALNGITPTVRYIGVESLEEAKNYFKMSIALFPEEEDIDNWKFINTIDVDDCHVEFTESKSSDKIAHVTIDCPELKSIITDIIFIPRSLWPENDQSSPFQYGSVWMKDNKYDADQITFYICVRPCGYGQKGIMLTFDRGWGTITYDECTYCQGEFDLYSNCASYDAIHAFAALVNDSPKKYQAAFDAIRAKCIERYRLDDPYTVQWYKEHWNLDGVEGILEAKKRTYDKFKKAINKEYMHFNVGSPNPSNPKKAEKYWVAKARWYYLVKVGYYVMEYNSEKGRYDTSSWTTTFKEKNTPYNVWPSYSFEFDYDNYPRDLVKVGK